MGQKQTHSKTTILFLFFISSSMLIINLHQVLYKACLDIPLV